jgi:hypothetical protein
MASFVKSSIPNRGWLLLTYVAPRWIIVDESEALPVRAIVPVISAFAIFVHAALGCCAHHVHAQNGQADCGRHGELVCTAQHADDGHGLEPCDHHHDSTPGQESDHSLPLKRDCDGARCLGIRAAKVMALDLADGVFGELPAAVQIGFLPRDGVLSAWLDGLSFAPHVRRHLAHCVLLV